MENKIKAVAFDFNGVLGDFNVKKLSPMFEGIDKIRFLRVLVHLLGILPQSKEFNQLFNDYESGSFTQTELIFLISRKYKGLGPIVKTILDEVPRTCEYNEDLFHFIGYLRGCGIKTAIITNNLPENKNTIDMYAPYMDFIAYSTTNHVRKDKKDIFRLTATQLGVKPEEMIYIDDKKEYTIPAKNLGITTIVHKNSNQTIAEINNAMQNYLSDNFRTFN